MNRSPWFALIACCLLPLASLAAQQNSADSDPSHHHRVDRALLLLKDDDAAAPKCHIDAEERKLEAAQDELGDLHLDAASDRFFALTQSCSPGVRDGATLGFRKTHREMSTWWWQVGRYFPPFRWWHIHYPRAWKVLGWAVGIVFALFGLLALARLWLKCAQWLIGKIPPGHSVIMTPTELTTGDKAQCEFFASMLQDRAVEVTNRVQHAGVGQLIGPTSCLSVPSDTAKNLGASLPKIKGVDLSALAKFLFYLMRYFGWRVESQVAFCPSSVATGGAPSTHARIVASATIRWAWMIKGGPWLVDVPVDDQYDLEAAAFALVVCIMGDYPPRKAEEMDALRFSDDNSFRLFIEGLGALQLYEKEASKSHPRQFSLEHWMKVALNRLSKCVSQYPIDPLPRFYLGIALATRNQEVYVTRLQQIRSACVAVGRELGFSDMSHDPKAKVFAECRPIESAIAHPFRELESAPWPFLDEAIHMFHSLLSDPNLGDVAKYNLVLAYGRLGGETLDLGLKMKPIEAPKVSAAYLVDLVKSPEKVQKATKAVLEGTILHLQFDCLCKSFEARCDIAQKAKAKFKDAFKEFEDAKSPIKKSLDRIGETLQKAAAQVQDDQEKKLLGDIAARLQQGLENLAFKGDLIADHLCREGYIWIECATSHLPVDDLSAEAKLEKAAECFTAALELKPNWNPPQIYLALVRRIQSGLAGAYVDFLEEQVKRAEPKKDHKIEIKLEIGQAESKPAQRSDEPKQESGTIKHLVKRAVTVFGEGIEKAIATRIENFTNQRLPEEGSSQGSAPTKNDEQKTSELSSLKRQLSVKTQQKDQFSQEADNLFAALQGEPWPVSKPDSSTAKDKTDPKPKAIVVLTSQTAKGPDQTNQDS